MTTTLADATPRVDPTCLHCGYNLHGINLEGSCPECGMAVRISIRDDRLADTPRHWRRTLRTGATMLLIGTLLTPVLLYFGLALATLGLWRLTVPQPDRFEPAADWRVRCAGRLLLGLGLLILLGLIMGLTSLFSFQGRSAWSGVFGTWRLVDGAFIAGHGCYALGVLAATSYLGTLAQRIPDSALFRQTRRTWRTWIAGLLAVVLIGAAASGANYLNTALNLSYPWTTAVLVLAMVVVMLWLWGTTLRLAWTLRRSLSAATG